jgi:hypothetical protein
MENTPQENKPVRRRIALPLTINESVTLQMIFKILDQDTYPDMLYHIERYRKLGYIKELRNHMENNMHYDYRASEQF